MSRRWTKRSGPLPSSSVMKPYPFVGLNHFTVPLLISASRPLLPYLKFPGFMRTYDVQCLEAKHPTALRTAATPTLRTLHRTDSDGSRSIQPYSRQDEI